MNIDINLAEKFQSFTSSVSARDLNKFVVLTGKNGAGKSQLLKLLSGTHYIQPTPEGTTTISVDNTTINSGEIVHLTAWEMPSAPSASAAEMNTISQQISYIINGSLQGQIQDIRQGYPSFSQKQIVELQQVVETLRQRGFNGYAKAADIDVDIIPLLSSDFDNHSAEILNERIGRIIYKAHFEALERRQDILQEEDPINIFNKLCHEFDMQFHLSPFQSALRPYTPILNDNEGNKVEWSQLSAGEMVIFRIITWIFYYKLNNTLYPKLLLLDEPDAHLTPKMIRRFIDSVQDVIIDQMGIAVIMTTHSPNTVALTEEATLYELVKNGGSHSINKITKKYALQTFSEGLIFVQEKTRMVFLEGKADTPFYSKFYDIAVTKHGIPNQPPLNFIAVSENDPEEGGCTKVVNMVRKFDDTIINDLIHGIIDRDKDNTQSDNIHVLSRYSIENYLYDPVVIVIALIRSGKHRDVLPIINHVDTNDIEVVLNNRSLLQQSADQVLAYIKEQLEDVQDESLVETTARTKYGDGVITYNIPQWFIDLKKANLTTGSLYKEGQALKPHISEAQQYLALESTAMIHEDLYTLLMELTS